MSPRQTPRPLDPRWQQALGDVLYRRRTSKGATLTALTAAVDVDPSHYRRIERGLGNIRLSTLVALAEFLEVSPSELLAEIESSIRA